jgi:hypothetical protein
MCAPSMSLFVGHSDLQHLPAASTRPVTVTPTGTSQRAQQERNLGRSIIAQIGGCLGLTQGREHDARSRQGITFDQPHGSGSSSARRADDIHPCKESKSDARVRAPAGRYGAVCWCSSYLGYLAGCWLIRQLAVPSVPAGFTPGARRAARRARCR